MTGRLLKYPRDWFRFDAVAGLTTAAVVIPKAMAFASIAGLPVQAGLYVALVPMFVYALMGTSRPLSVSSTSTLAILTAAELAVVVPGGEPGKMMAAASTLALLVGGMLLLAGILRLGFLANFISDPILTGFKAGIGLVIVVDQLPKLLGVHIVRGNFFHDLFSTLKHVAEANHATLILAVAMLAILLGMERFFPKTPAPLVAVVLGVAAARFLGLNLFGVALTGHIPAGIPTPAIPDLSLVRALWPGALGMALMSFTESIAAGRAFAAHDDPPPLPNRELITLGAANLAGSFFQCFPAGGGTSQTAVNSRAGARTQVAALVTVAMVFGSMGRLSENSVLNMKNKSHSVTAQINVPKTGAEGVIIAQGGNIGGWSLYMKGGKLKYCYNLLGIQQFYAESSGPVPAGDHQVRMEFTYDGGGLGKGGTATLFVDGKKVGEGKVAATAAVVFSADDGCDVGVDTGSPVSPDYGPRGNEFTGTVKGVQLAIAEDAEAVDHLVDPEHALQVAMARQ